MPIIDTGKFVSDVKSGGFCQRYIFAGEEEYLKRHYLSMLRGGVVRDESLAAFNYIAFDGEEIDFASLTDAIKAPPMMSEYKLVEWRYCDFTKMKEADLAELDSLVAMHRDYPYTVLAFVAVAGGMDFGTGRKKSKFLERYERNFDILRFQLSADKQLYSWLKKHFDKEGISFGMDSAVRMVERIGHSMDMLKGEVDKLCAYVKSKGRGEITPADVDRVCSAVKEEEAFAFSNALAERNRQKAFAALDILRSEHTEPSVIFAMASRTYTELFDVCMLLEEGKRAEEIGNITGMQGYKLRLYLGYAKRHTVGRLRDTLTALVKVDAESKSGGISGYTAVELFVSKYI